MERHEGSRVMKWFKSYTDEDESPFMGELTSLFGLKGYYFYKRTLGLMAKHFDIFNPGCKKFNKQYFYQQYYPAIKDRRTVEKMLKFAQSQLEIFYFEDGSDIVLYCPSIEKRADTYTIRAFKDVAEKDKEIALNVGFLHELCTKHAQKIAHEVYFSAKESAENKEDKQKTVRTDFEGCVRRPSYSSSRKEDYLTPTKRDSESESIFESEQSSFIKKRKPAQGSPKE